MVNDWEAPWTKTSKGMEERMTRVKDQETIRASTRQVRNVVTYWTSMPVLREEAILTSSVSLREWGALVGGVCGEREGEALVPGELCDHSTGTSISSLAVT